MKLRTVSVCQCNLLLPPFVFFYPSPVSPHNKTRSCSGRNGLASRVCYHHSLYSPHITTLSIHHISPLSLFTTYHHSLYSPHITTLYSPHITTSLFTTYHHSLFTTYHHSLYSPQITTLSIHHISPLSLFSLQRALLAPLSAAQRGFPRKVNEQLLLSSALRPS